MRMHAGKPSSRKLGQFLVHSQMQGSVHSSAMFMTGAAQNLLCLKLAAEVGVPIPNPFLTWLKAGFLPAIVGLAVTPLILYQVSPPALFMQDSWTQPAVPQAGSRSGSAYPQPFPDLAQGRLSARHCGLGRDAPHPVSGVHSSACLLRVQQQAQQPQCEQQQQLQQEQQQQQQ